MFAHTHSDVRSSAPRYFPSPREANAAGLMGVGGTLDPEHLLDAYTHGIFPWPLADGMLAWWSPDPRAVLELDELHVSRRLHRTCHGGAFEITIDRDFAAVIAGCAGAQGRRAATWITPDMRDAYQRLHALGIAHSVEAWHGGELAGGVYGLAIGGYFAAESMFYAVRDASKVALVALVERLRARGFTLLDIQQLTPHTQRLGAREIARSEFLARLDEALRQPARFVP